LKKDYFSYRSPNSYSNRLWVEPTDGGLWIDVKELSEGQFRASGTSIRLDVKAAIRLRNFLNYRFPQKPRKKENTT
jgi:hypothetical protein